MEPREHYTSKDFKRYARKEFANDFTAFRNAYICMFERKTYFDEHNAAHDIDVLLGAGHCDRRALLFRQGTREMLLSYS
jgi:hypothetical protein